ncbi:hypothetical protein XENTR_v10000509 [Xenopus tropicalis]|nr:hypothetical protein XENTR_v10000509 [Xenopus tropicalis]
MGRRDENSIDTAAVYLLALIIKRCTSGLRCSRNFPPAKCTEDFSLPWLGVNGSHSAGHLVLLLHTSWPRASYKPGDLFNSAKYRPVFL